MTKRNWDSLYMIEDDWERMGMTDAAYNGGPGGLASDRRICGLKIDCDPNKWFGHVELTSNKSRKPLYGGRSAFDINRHHVKDVLITRRPKYELWFENHVSN